ncbi:hypothetical protein [Pseudoxanthomonas dokdonensis]|uniref:EF-hand domain-containing protein n=1 Tax=Pseudoxanthomonas dokdonensis TaxID=344882 RepID=A0A0R0CFG5_9GAMM|nr:hypothetical protein [Pseudoxanthomonas dokdonensis]KRG67979.1 hypothetical protein ABB29_14450 [Pseudoxanthomonas dokdonensis]
MSRHRRFTGKRKALLILVALLLALVAYLHFTGSAGTRGLETKDMDWDGNGQVTETEIMQAYYAVVVEEQIDGNRVCKSYEWRDGHKLIRVDCVTRMQPAAKAE